MVLFEIKVWILEPLSMDLRTFKIWIMNSNMYFEFDAKILSMFPKNLK